MTADSTKMLSPGEYMSYMRDVGLIGDDLSVHDARLIFMWSRMRVIDEDDRTARERIENLTFWGFLEAMVRVAQSKALPTNEQVHANQRTSALTRRRKSSKEGRQAFIHSSLS